MFSKPTPKTFVCPVCDKSFGRKDTLNRHMKKHVDVNNFHCDCGVSFTRKDNLLLHRRKYHQEGGKRPLEEEAMPAPKRLKSNPEAYYDLRKIRETRSRKFSTVNSIYKVNIKDLEVRNVTEIIKTLKILLTSILKELTKYAEDDDLIRLAIRHPELDFPIQLPFMRRSQLTVEQILAQIERVLQSFEQFVLDGDFEIDIIHVKNPRGGAKAHNSPDLETFLQEKKCIVRIKNTDDLCCARALVTAKAKIDKDPQYPSIKNGTGVQRHFAVNLHEAAGVPLGKCGIEEIKIFQSYLVQYQIHVISREDSNAIIYSGPEAERKIYLYLHNCHYDVITSMPAFLNRTYYCHICQQGYDNKDKHECNNPCYLCRKIHQEVDEERIYCDDCHRYFKGEECFDLHKKATEKGNSTCGTYYRCLECDQLINKKRQKKEHKCGEVYCKTCKDYFLPGHECYMMPLEDENETKAQTYIFFDFECTQDSINECSEGFTPDSVTTRCQNCNKSKCGSFEHRPNLCVVQKVCLICLESEVTETTSCEHCGPNEIVFSGVDTTEKFCKWLFSKGNKGATVICHNFKGYDSYPILQYLYKNAVLPKVVPNGATNMSIEVPSFKIRMIDSINFLPAALAKLPKMFGLTELAKGYFPHYFNTQENQFAILNHLPNVQFYNPDGMKKEEREVFLEWYEKNKCNSFNLQEELLKYCRSDVDILRRACLNFRTLFMSMTGGMDPFQKCITIASACMRVFRRNFLEPQTIGLIPAQGYRPEEKHSVKALQWIKYLEHIEGAKIQHARNGGETQVGNYKLDGYYQSSTGERIALEFHGCLWHGCVKCFSRSTVNPINGKSMEELYQATLDKQCFLESQGFLYICKWECDWEREIQENQSVQEFIASLEIVTPLEPRDAFFGGRTEAFTLYKEASENERIKYYDVTSLYPFINKTGKYPLGHPARIFEDFGTLDQYEGLVKCKVLPPRQLQLPVLPVKINNKLMFSLCRSCTEAKQQTTCTHDESERAFQGTWITDELKKAVEKGYQILKIYEIWHFDQIEQYDPTTKTGGLFTEYINTFLKMKQEASGRPSWCVTESQKQSYIADYEAREGIILESIEKNPGLRSLAKLMLNSFWGKFGQRANMTQLEHVRSPKKYFDLLTSDRQEVTDMTFVSDDMVELRWKYKEDFVETSSKTNVVIAAYTTAQARLKLYSYLEMLGERVLYCDTDSIVFTTKQGEAEPCLGDYLGDLTDEVPDGIISQFVSGGPKNYALKIRKPYAEETMVKVRGITLNYKNSLEINFDTVRDMVMDPSQIITTQNTSIVRDSKTRTLLTTEQTKEYKIVFDKRVITTDYMTLPYGF